LNSPPPTGCLKYTGYLKARFDYDPATLQLTTENLDATFYQGQTLVRSIDSLGRPSGYSLQDVASSALSVVNYTYGSSGRLSTVSDGTDTFTYAYENNSNLLASLTGPQHTTAYTYEPNRNVMTILDNQVSGSSLAKYAYSYDALGRRDDRSQSGSAISTSTDDFSYNSRSEVIASSNSAETTAKWNPTYSFDNIGNRKSSTGFQPVASYSSNNVNQYSAIGSASPIHDLDGNLTSDGGTWTYTWNNENRLTTATSGSARLRFTYDYQGRLVQQLKETENQTTGNWETDDSVVFVYDGWNRIAKYIDSTLDSTYLFGLDLSGSMQGAGGVGGLLKEGDLYPTYDANGNVMQKLDGTGATVMNVVYDPFGNMISGILVGEYGFSTKPLIDDLDWYYYGFRYYDPETGRWPSRDPIGKEGGLNVYAMVANDTVSKWDVLGQKPPCSDFSKTRGSGDSAEGRTDDIQDSTPVPNGCSNPVPIPANMLFRPVCNGHDICYQTCGSDKSSCDSQFLSDMRDICNSFLPWLPQVAARCHVTALVFYRAVVAFGGSFHEEGQDERCKWEACCE